MIVYDFPPSAQRETAAFSIVGRHFSSGTLCGELMLIPRNALPEHSFCGPLFYLDEPRVDRFPICTRTLVPEALAGRFPDNPVYISSLLSGGTLEARLCEARSAFGDRLWLLLAPFSHFFPLPCPDGNGRFLPERGALLPQAESAFSSALCCRFQAANLAGLRGVYLFDTPQTISHKLALADQCGILNVLVLPFGAAHGVCAEPLCPGEVCPDAQM